MSAWRYRYSFLILASFIFLGGGALWIHLKLIQGSSVHNPKHGFRITPREASGLLVEYFERRGMNLHLPYLYVASEKGYLFGYPPNSKTGPPYTISESACYEVNGNSGNVRKLSGPNDISTMHYQFLSNDDSNRAPHASNPQPARDEGSPSGKETPPDKNDSVQRPGSPPSAKPPSAP